MSVVVAVLRDRGVVDACVQDLVDAGFELDAIVVACGADEAACALRAIGSADEAVTRGVARAEQGGAVIVVRADPNQGERAAEVVGRYAPLEVAERSVGTPDVTRAPDQASDRDHAA